MSLHRAVAFTHEAAIWPTQEHTFVETSVDAIGHAAWERLLDASRAPIFYSWNFLKCMEERPLTCGALAYYVGVRAEDGTALAVTVVYLQTTKNPFNESAAAAERLLAGHVWHCYDTRVLSLVSLTGRIIAALRGAIERLSAELHVSSCGLYNIRLDGELGVLLQASGQGAAVTTPCYRLAVQGNASLDAHLSHVGRASRRTLRHYWRRALAAGALISFDVARDSLAEDVLALCVATANKHAPGYYPPEELRVLLMSLGEACRVIRVELEGILLATSICLLDATSAHFWAGGALYPPDLNWSPQYVLFAAELHYGFATGKPVIEFGRRNDEFKRRYGLTPCALGAWTLGRSLA